MYNVFLSVVAWSWLCQRISSSCHSSNDALIFSWNAVWIQIDLDRGEWQVWESLDGFYDASVKNQSQNDRSIWQRFDFVPSRNATRARRVSYLTPILLTLRSLDSHSQSCIHQQDDREKHITEEIWILVSQIWFRHRVTHNIKWRQTRKSSVSVIHTNLSILSHPSNSDIDIETKQIVENLLVFPTPRTILRSIFRDDRQQSNLETFHDDLASNRRHIALF